MFHFHKLIMSRTLGLKRCGHMRSGGMSLAEWLIFLTSSIFKSKNSISSKIWAFCFVKYILQYCYWLSKSHASVTTAGWLTSIPQVSQAATGRNRWPSKYRRKYPKYHFRQWAYVFHILNLYLLILEYVHNLDSIISFSEHVLDQICPCHIWQITNSNENAISSTIWLFCVLFVKQTHNWE